MHRQQQTKNKHNKIKKHKKQQRTNTQKTRNNLVTEKSTIYETQTLNNNLTWIIKPTNIRPTKQT